MITKDITLSNGTVASCHILRAINSKMPFDSVRVTVQSYASEAAYLAGSPYVFTDDFDQAINWPTSPSEIEALLVSAGDSRFLGGAIAADQSMSLEASQDRAWARIKRSRAAADAADFECDGNVYKADKEYITGGVLMAKIASDAGQPFSTEFTLANDTPITLDAAQMMAVGQALSARIEAVFARGRAKRIAIYSATSVSSLDEITWDSP